VIKFLLTSWWLYIPIIGILLYLTRRNNQKIKEIKILREQHHQPNVQAAASLHPQKFTRIRRAAGKLGLSGAINHLRR
jgi:hypothetical protein